MTNEAENRFSDENRNSPINISAFIGFVMYIAEKGDERERFKQETGLSLSIPTSPIEQAVGEATGHTRAMLIAFAEWVAKTHWGVEYAPDMDVIFK